MTPESDPLNLFIQAFRVDRATAQVLVNEGFTSLEEVAYVPHWELEKVPLPGWLVTEIRKRARDLLLGE